MKRSGSFLLAAIIIPILFFTAFGNDDFLAISPSNSDVHKATVTNGSTDDLFNSPSGWRYRTSQPGHWIYQVTRR